MPAEFAPDGAGGESGVGDGALEGARFHGADDQVVLTVFLDGAEKVDGCRQPH